MDYCQGAGLQILERQMDYSHFLAPIFVCQMDCFLRALLAGGAQLDLHYLVLAQVL
jgi:hypothetical protein